MSPQRMAEQAAQGLVPWIKKYVAPDDRIAATDDDDLYRALQTSVDIGWRAGFLAGLIVGAGIFGAGFFITTLIFDSP